MWNESLSFLESIYTRDLRVTMMKERCQGFHVWRGDSLFRKSIFASDGIVADMKKEKLTGIAYKALAEI